MPRACGVRIGPRRFELFVLDGNPKKPKVVISAAGEYATGDDMVAAAAEALAEAIRAHDVPRDNVGVAIDARHAAFRRLQLPVSDPAKIEQVLKFEVEGQLPQFNIDDVVVDFLILESTPSQSGLLVTAVPKEDLRRVIEICTAAGFDPTEIELDTTAMVNAALASGLCTVEGAQVFVHVGEESTAVAVVDGTKLREMRAIQFGALTGRGSHGSAPADAEATEDLEAALSSEADEAQRVTEIVGRIRRELSRTVSGARTANPLEAIHVSGYLLPGIDEGEVLGVPLLTVEEHRIDAAGEDGEGRFGSAQVAYGAALRQLGGGVLRPRLRREELRYSGTLERLELPLAVLALLLVTLLGVFNIFVQKDRQEVDMALERWRDSSNNFMYPDPAQGKVAKLRYPSDRMKNYVTTLRSQGSDPGGRNVVQQLTWIRQTLAAEKSTLERELGSDGEIQQPQSALRAMTLLLDLLDRHKDEIRRPSLRSMAAAFEPARAGKPERVRITLNIVFFGASATEGTNDFERFKTLVEMQPWYVEFDDRTSKPLEGRGIQKDGIAIEIDVSKALDGASS